MKKDDLLIVELGLDATNDDIMDKMRVMKSAREAGVQNVVCLVRSFNHDARELFEIPEVRAFCRRLVTLGFHSYLDFVTSVIDIGQPDSVRLAWGAVEVWLCSEGAFKSGMELTKGMLDEWESMVNEANAKADALLGPMRNPS